MADANGATGFAQAADADARARLWKARHEVFWANNLLRPGSESVATDVCVPISRLAACITQTADDLATTGLLAPIVGHVGDGNFHVQLLIDPASAQEAATAQAFLARLTERALAMDGTCTGEHGIGQRKRAYMAAEHGPALLAMRAVKAALDPHGLFNPGKILP